jgi:hypothetical protein
MHEHGSSSGPPGILRQKNMHIHHCNSGSTSRTRVPYMWYVPGAMVPRRNLRQVPQRYNHTNGVPVRCTRLDGGRGSRDGTVLGRGIDDAGGVSCAFRREYRRCKRAWLLSPNKVTGWPMSRKASRTSAKLYPAGRGGSTMETSMGGGDAGRSSSIAILWSTP